jgi:hypothetical protein
MKFNAAVEKSIKAFLDGKMPEKLMEVSEEELIYTPEYMDALEEEFLNEEVEIGDEDEA